MRKFEWERKPSKNQPTSKENITIIRALNNFGRVPEQHELLDEIEKLQQELQRKDNIINGIKKEINEQLEEYEKGKEEYKNYGNLEDYAKGLRSAYISILDKINELEGENE